MTKHVVSDSTNTRTQKRKLSPIPNGIITLYDGHVGSTVGLLSTDQAFTDNATRDWRGNTRRRRRPSDERTVSPWG